MRDQLVRLCDNARDGRAALSGLFAVPASVLGAAAVVRFPREIRITRTVPAGAPPRAGDDA
ncbi:MAG: hypothetical protein GEV11_00995 [Streptosporangiales bacterium]|nr:hypothetical protein [Streptosporangiales bacterium]